MQDETENLEPFGLFVLFLFENAICRQKARTLRFILRFSFEKCKLRSESSNPLAYLIKFSE